ncbi:MAG TPA: hypothetical protein VIV60_10300, partial [Polyangiaceae bacterium]
NAATEPSFVARQPKVEANGYLVHREGYSHIEPSSPVSSRDVPSFTQLVEANLQLRVPLGSQQHFAYADLSLIFQRGGLYYKDGGNGDRVRIPNHDVMSLRPAFVPSELYVSWSPKPWFNVLAGKKRVTWGSGFAYNPTDLINPPKDPTDPNFQRAGNWLVRLEAPFEKFTATALFAPQALDTTAGIPSALVRYPSYAPADGPDLRDSHSHYLAAARLYWLVADADVNLVYYFSNYYQDGFAKKSRLGLSFSRYFFTDYELHVEALLSRGSSRGFADRDCMSGVARCSSTEGFAPTKLEADRIYPRVLVGTRRQFTNEALLSFEYYYQSDGYSRSEFRDALELLLRAKSAEANGAGTSVGTSVNTPTGSGTVGGSALPQRFSFNTLRRHYVIASYSQPHIYDDWTLGAVLVVGAEDLSGLFSPSVAWTAEEWLTLSLYGYVPIRGLGVNEAKLQGRSYSEYSLMPFDWRVLFEARAYY